MESNYSSIDLEYAAFTADEDFEDVMITGQLPAFTIAPGVRVKHSKIVRASLSGSKLERFYLTSVAVDRLEAVGTDCYKASWHSVAATASRLTGCKLSEATLADCTFDGCAMNLSLFRFATLKKCSFSKCNMRGADFSGATFKNVSFDGCDLTGADFTNATLASVDLRNAVITDIKGIPNLKGAIISSDQLIGLAYSLAAEIGITVDDGR